MCILGNVIIPQGKHHFVSPVRFLETPPGAFWGFYACGFLTFQKRIFQVFAFRGPPEGPEGAQTSKSHKNGALRDPRNDKIDSGTP